MEHNLHIELRDREGALLRTLGMVERRGFRVRQCHAVAPSSGRQTLQLQIDSVRSVAVLQRQLERLHDVFSVQVTPVVASIVPVQDSAKRIAK